MKNLTAIEKTIQITLFKDVLNNQFFTINIYRSFEKYGNKYYYTTGQSNSAFSEKYLTEAITAGKSIHGIMHITAQVKSIEEIVKHALSDFDIDNLDAFETNEFNYIKSKNTQMSKSEILQILINNVDGDTTQLSECLAEIAEMQGNDVNTMFELTDNERSILVNSITQQ